MTGQPWFQFWTRDVMAQTADLDADSSLALILTAGLCNASPSGTIDPDRRKLGRLWKVSTHRAGRILAELEATGRVRIEPENLFFIGFLLIKNAEKVAISDPPNEIYQGVKPPLFSEEQNRTSPYPHELKAELFKWAEKEGLGNDVLEQLWLEHCDAAVTYRYQGERFRAAWRDLCRKISRRPGPGQRSAGHARPGTGSYRRSRSGIVDGACRLLTEFQDPGGLRDLDGRPRGLATARLARAGA